MSILQTNNVHYVYQSKYQKVHAVKGIDFCFEKGRFYAIVGKSGCGKSTFLSMLAGLDLPTDGEILYNGKSTAQLNRDEYRLRDISLICQSFNLFPLLTVEENVMYPMLLRKVKPDEAKAAAQQKLAEVGLEETYLKRLPAMLSGGEQQRVAIARALASDARIILADEPTGNLDTENSELVFSLLQRLAHEEGYCVIVVTHDLSISNKADQVLRLKDGALIE
ncbi:MAG: ABC transporter ATP-binding protein [Lachnospiraceae bacterium]|nr:ABC transporter ATP-binding protein [Lachnospiraceae bacterium]